MPTNDLSPVVQSYAGYTPQISGKPISTADGAETRLRKRNVAEANKNLIMATLGVTKTATGDKPKRKMVDYRFGSFVRLLRVK